ncbi:MAG: S-layer homology domain-containing protein [Oscillibacter sp.]|nr:S-layer homology domain-containing protein [Oscillibacter sp.]
MNKLRLPRITAAFCALCLLVTFLPQAYAAPAPDIETYALSAGSPDILYTVTPGGSIALNAGDFRAFFYAHYQTDTFRFVTFQSDSSLKASNGILYCDYATETETAFTRNMLEEARFYDRSDLYGTYPLETLSFVANRQAEGNTVTLVFNAFGDSESCVGQVDIAVQGTASAAALQETSVVDLTWHVTAGDILRFDRNDFREFFKDHATAQDSFRSLTFQPDDSFQPDKGYLYYDFEGKSEKLFNADMLRDADFFYSSSRYGSYPISGMTFLAANEAGGTLVRLPFTVHGRTEHYSGTLVIQINWAKASNTNPAPVYGPSLPSASAPAEDPVQPETPPTSAETPPASTETPSTSTETPSASTETPPASTETPSTSTETPSAPAETDADIVYLVRAGERVEFDLLDFSTPAQAKLKGTFRYVTFRTIDTLSAETGFLLVNVGGLEETMLTAQTIDDFRFYADSDKYGDYALESLSFSVPLSAPARTVHLECTLHDSRQDTAVITMLVRIQAADPEQLETARTELAEPTPTEPVQEPNEPVTPTEPVQEPEKPAPTEPVQEPGEPVTPTEPVPQPGEPVQPASEAVNITEPFEGTPVPAGNLLYAATWNTPFRLVSDDFERFFRKTFPGGTISHVSFSNLPLYGTLFYDYYASSAYGDSPKMELLFGNLSYMRFYFSPAFADRYSLAELTYVPVVEKNYCETIAFSVTGLDADKNMVQCTGNILLSVTKAPIEDVYGAIPKGRTVTFPASNLAQHTKDATGADMDGFRLLELPDPAVGSVVVGEDKTPADPAQIYHWSDIQPKISDLRFVPADDFTGSVDIPYLVADGDGNAAGIGHFTLGIISTLKRFSDVTSGVWCYKYVTELAAAGVIGGYGDDTYRPGISVTWGAALKLIMLAAGYPEQQGTTMSPFQGYLDKAVADGLLPHEIDLWEPVTRLEVAELTAAAMKLDTSHLSSVQPFSDTDNVSVKALNAAGIINGYYEEGVSTFRPGGTLNRGQAAAIVWRMRNYQD